MFNNCSSLVSLNINNFNSSLVTKFNNIFKNCSSIKFLDFSKYNETYNNRLKSQLISYLDHNLFFCLNFDFNETINIRYNFSLFLSK